MTARAHVVHNFPAAGVDVHLATGDMVLEFPPTLALRRAGEADPAFPAQPLTLSDDMARALYEALAEHYGHSGHDMRALRKDYDAERARVDKLVDHLVRTDR